jgi:hypothetical protein
MVEKPLAFQNYMNYQDIQRENEYYKKCKVACIKIET